VVKERLQQVGFAGLIGAVAGATLTAHRGRAAAAVGALAGAAGLGAAEAVARARQRPGEIPALWSRILASGALLMVAGIAGVAGCAALVVAIGARRGQSRPARAARAIAADLRRGLLVPGVWPQLTLASLLVVAGHTATFVIAARVAGCTAPLGELIALLMVVQIAAGIPLSVGGWGPREGIAAWAFAAAGLGAANGVTVATLYAVLMLAAVTPGAGLLLKDAVRRHRGREHLGEWSGPDPAPPTRHPAWREAERLVP